MEKDLRSLQLIYEDMEGRPMAQYGNDASGQPSHVIGTEPLIQRQVELPKDAGNESEKDDEDQNGETSFEKILDSINQTIRRYEQRKKARFDDSIDDVDEELHENTIINEFVGGFVGGLSRGINAGSYGSGANFVKELKGYGKKLKSDAEKNKNKSGLKIIGENDIKAKEGLYVHPLVNGNLHEEIIGVITLVEGKKYTVHLIGLREPTEAEALKTMKKDLIEINSEYGFAKKLEKGVEITKSSVVILNKAIFNKKIKKYSKIYTKLTTDETFTVGLGNIKWAIFDPYAQDLVKSKTKAAVGEVFEYNSQRFVMSGTGWAFPKKGDETKPNPAPGKLLTDTTTPTKEEVQNAWLSK
jgi:hypothetical protein